jgi:hypothetical protein
LNTLVKLGKFFKALKPLKQRLLNKRSFGLNMVPDSELFSSGSDPANIFATAAFNNRGRDGIGVVALRLATRRKVVRVKTLKTAEN